MEPLSIELLPTDTCDKCGPHVTANVAIRLNSGGALTFCMHDYSKYMYGLATTGIAKIVMNKDMWW